MTDTCLWPWLDTCDGMFRCQKDRQLPYLTFAQYKVNTLDRLGVKTRIFHLGDYRRATIPFGEDMPDDYFFVNGEWVTPMLARGVAHTHTVSSIRIICSASPEDCTKVPRGHLPLFESREWSDCNL